jgi:uncharacterized protein
MFLAPDVFVVPDDDVDTSIAYAPLLGIVARVNRRMTELLRRWRELPGGQFEIDDSTVHELVRLGLVSYQPYPRLEPDSRDAGFDLTSVSLFLTSACNLACTYCHASANERPIRLPAAAARAALRLVLERAACLGRSQISVSLHGGGEPSLEWRLLEEVVDYVRRSAERKRLEVRMSIGTNGVMEEAKARWIGKHFDSATLSLDGTRDVHDRFRPTVAGHPTFDTVMRTAEVFDAAGLSYAVRMTVTAAWADRLAAAVDDICRHLAVPALHVEPVFAAGRAARHQVAAPSVSAFIAAFRAARAVAARHGRRLIYSGARLGAVTDRFCQAPGKSFAVTPGGQVSSCYEVTDPSDPRSEAFFWGAYQAAADRFELDETHRAAQTRWTVHHHAGCAACYCKWTCAGDCPAKRELSGEPRDPGVSPRCVLIRTLTRDQMLAALGAGKPIPRSQSVATEESPCT